MKTNNIFSEQHDIWATPYKFNGKELDAETGLYYYGARYYTPEIGIWLSVDPLSDKYPSLSPYAYCAGNPVKYIDPNGMEIGDYWEFNSKTNSFTWIANDGIDDGKNYILKQGGDKNQLNSDNYENYPTESQRQSIASHWDQYDNKSNYDNHSVEGTRYRGTFYEEQGIFTSSGQHFTSGPGEKVFPTAFGNNTEVSTPQMTGNEVKGMIEIIYHFHPTAKKQAVTTSGETYGTKAPPFLFNQSVGNWDMSKASNSATNIMISRQTGVNFYNSSGTTLQIPLNVFRQALPSVPRK